MNESPTQQVTDHQAVELMLGREPRGKVIVAKRCHLGLPVVIKVEPILPDGTPFPTLYWLTCPLAVKRISQLESSGMIKELEESVDVSAANDAYASERNDALASQMTTFEEDYDKQPKYLPHGGVGGSHGGIKCLHARYAYWLVGGNDPAGSEAAKHVGKLDCLEHCVASGKVEIISPGPSGPGAITEAWRGSGALPAIQLENPFLQGGV